MTKVIFNRIIQSIISLILVSFLVFIFLSSSVDPAILLLPPHATEEQVIRMQQQMGLDRPVMERYFIFLKGSLRGDFGTSIRQRRPALGVVIERIPATFTLSFSALAFSLLISFPLGIIAAVKRGSIIDSIALIIAILGQSVPVFWIGLLFIMFFSLKLGWLPTGGIGNWKHLIMPAFALGWHINGLMTRMVRSSMLEVLKEDYVTTARSKGLTERVVVFKHALKNAFIPIITIFGLQAGTILVGTVVVETVFSWPGIGRAAITAVQGRDYPVVLASVFVFTIIFIGINLIVDLTYSWIDPRIKYN